MIMNTKFKRPKFTTEFKQGAVKRVTEQGYTRQAAADSLGISLRAITRWVKAESGSQARPGNAIDNGDDTQHERQR